MIKTPALSPIAEKQSFIKAVLYLINNDTEGFFFLVALLHEYRLNNYCP